VKQEHHALSAYLLLGRAYVSLKEYQKAIAPLQHVVETTPDNSLARYELGCALVKTGRWNEAAPQFEAAVSDLNSSAMMHFYLALVYQQTSRNDEALAEFKDALRWGTEELPCQSLVGADVHQTTKSGRRPSSSAKGRSASPGRDRSAPFLGGRIFPVRARRKCEAGAVGSRTHSGPGGIETRCAVRGPSGREVMSLRVRTLSTLPRKELDLKPTQTDQDPEPPARREIFPARTRVLRSV
jgi:hypothetical protein